MNLRPGSWPDLFHSFRAGFTLSFGFLTTSSLKRSTTMAMALTPHPFVKTLLFHRYSLWLLDCSSVGRSRNASQDHLERERF